MHSVPYILRGLLGGFRSGIISSFNKITFLISEIALALLTVYIIPLLENNYGTIYKLAARSISPKNQVNKLD